MRTVRGTAKRNRRKLTLYSLAAAVVAAAGAVTAFQLASNASATARPDARQIQQSKLQQHAEFLREHPLSAGQAEAFRKKAAREMQGIEQRATTAPYTPLRTGLSQGTQGGPFSSCEFKLQSVYVSPASGAAKTQILAYAGTNISQTTCKPTDGAVYLFQASSASPVLQRIGVFNSLAISSPLKIMTVKGNILELRSLSGDRLTFNLKTHKYIKLGS